MPGVPFWLPQVSRSFCLSIFPLIAYLGYREKRLTLELIKSTRLAAEHTSLQEKSQWLQKTVAEVQDLYDHAPCGYHSLDSTGLIVAINQTESDWLGYSKEELIGQNDLQNSSRLLESACSRTISESYHGRSCQGRRV